MAHKTLAIIAVLSLAGLAFLIYLALTFEDPGTTRTVELDQPIPRPAETRVLQDPATSAENEQPASGEQPSGDEEPEVQISLADALEELEPQEPAEPLPSLNESDDYVLQRLSDGLTAQLLPLVVPDDVIRKFVVYVQNVSQGELPQMDYPLRQLTSDFVVEEVDTNLYELDPASYDRYNNLVNVLVSLEPDQAVRIYRSMRPLFQEAYAEIGYQGDFDDVLVQAIDQVLDARTVEGPFQLIKPSVMFLYADSTIEDMTSVEKQLLRMGPENAARLKARLPAYKERLQAGL